MRPLKIFTIIAILLAFAISLYIGSHGIAEVKSDCQIDVPISTTPGNPNPLPPCYCSSVTPFEYDTMNSGVTIAPGGSTLISIKGGCPPYIWDDPGHGYSWASGSSTYGTSNILICDAGT